MLCFIYLFASRLQANVFLHSRLSDILCLRHTIVSASRGASHEGARTHHVTIWDKVQYFLVSNATRPPQLTNTTGNDAQRLVTAVHWALHGARATNFSISHLRLPNKSPSARDCVRGGITSAARKQNRRAPGDEI